MEAVDTALESIIVGSSITIISSNSIGLPLNVDPIIPVAKPSCRAMA